MADGLDTIRCSRCHKETYAGLEKCPHCDAELIAAEDDRSKGEPTFAPPEIPHAAFRKLMGERKMQVVLDKERIKSGEFYSLFPTYHVIGIIFVAVASILIGTAGITTMIMLDLSRAVPTEDRTGKMIIGTTIGLIFGVVSVRNWVRRRLVRRRMVRNAQFYRECIGKGFARVIERPSGARKSTWNVFE